MKVGKKLRDAGKNVYFAVSDKAEFSYEISEYGLAPDSDKPVVSATNSKGQKFAMKNEFRYGAIVFFSLLSDLSA